jgi:RND family efflux transporter MFP subunit
MSFIHIGRRKGLTRASLLVAVAAAFSAFGCGGTEVTTEPPAPPEVTVAYPEQRDVTNYLEFTGQTRAFEAVEVVARIPGVLEEMHFEPSKIVQEGDLLFVIEPEPYIASRDAADADVKTWEAELVRANADLERLEQAIQTNAVSAQEVDRARADVQQAEANLLGARAGLDQAEINLEYTQVRSPITGMVSRNVVDVGNLVGSGGSTVLTTVMRIKPIYAYFDMSERYLLEALSARDITVADPPEDAPAYLGLANEEGWPHEGQIDYIDNTVNTNTGTIQIRAVFPNDRGQLFPGLFARLRLPVTIEEGALLVSEQALGTDLGGKCLLIVGDDDVVELRHVELGALEGELRVIRSGIEARERYIINGLQRARPGLPVTPTMQPGSAGAGGR